MHNTYLTVKKPLLEKKQNSSSILLERCQLG